MKRVKLLFICARGFVLLHFGAYFWEREKGTMAQSDPRDDRD